MDNTLNENKNQIHEVDTLTDNNHYEYDLKFRALHGVQKGIVIYICNSINQVDDKFAYTKPITISDMANYTNTSRATVASTLTRLKQKNLITTYQHKTGKGGFSLYTIEKNFFQFIEKYKKNEGF